MKWITVAALLLAQYWEKLLDRKYAPNLIVLKSDHTGSFYARQHYYIVKLRDKALCIERMRNTAGSEIYHQ